MDRSGFRAKLGFPVDAAAAAAAVMRVHFPCLFNRRKPAQIALGSPKWKFSDDKHRGGGLAFQAPINALRLSWLESIWNLWGAVFL